MALFVSLEGSEGFRGKRVGEKKEEKYSIFFERLFF